MADLIVIVVQLVGSMIWTSGSCP